MVYGSISTTETPRTNVMGANYHENIRTPSPSAGDVAREEKELGPLPEEPRIAVGDSIIDVPPDGGYGWVCVGCVFMIVVCTWGANASYGVFLAYYLDANVFPEATPFEFALIGGLGAGCSCLSSPVVTFVLSKTSTKKAMAIGVVLETASFIGASFATRIWHLFLSQGICFGLGMGFLFNASLGTLSQWFTKKRSIANGLAAAGSGFGGLLFSLAVRAIIRNMGIAWAFRIIGIIVFSVNTVAILLIRDRDKQINPTNHSFDIALLQRYEFLLIVFWGSFSLLGYVAVLYSLPNWASSLGFTENQGSILGAILNLGMGLGRPIVGLISDRWGRINIGMILTFLSGLFCLIIWIPANSFGVGIFFALVEGAVCGTYWAVFAPVCLEVVGIRDLQSAITLCLFTAALPVMFSEAIAIQLRRPHDAHPYLHSQIFCGVLFIGASGMLYPLRAWKIAQNDRKRQDCESPVIGPNVQGKESLLDKWQSEKTTRWLRSTWV